MSDIPVGRPPAPPGRHAAPAGWYPDPIDPRRSRYWDGWQWSRETREQTAPQPAQQQMSPDSAGASSKRAATTVDGVPLASWGARFGAWLIDMVIMQVLAMLIALPVWQQVLGRFGGFITASVDAVERGDPPPPQPPMETMIMPDEQRWLALAMVVSVIIVQTVFLVWRSATPGQLMVGIRPISMKRGGATQKLSGGAILVRTFARGLLPQFAAYWPVAVLVIADGLFAVWDPKRQSLHDKISGTQVIRRR